MLTTPGNTWNYIFTSTIRKWSCSEHCLLFFSPPSCTWLSRQRSSLARWGTSLMCNATDSKLNQKKMMCTRAFKMATMLTGDFFSSILTCLNLPTFIPIRVFSSKQQNNQKPLSELASEWQILFLQRCSGVKRTSTLQFHFHIHTKTVAMVQY